MFLQLLTTSNALLSILASLMTAKCQIYVAYFSDIEQKIDTFILIRLS